MNLKTTLAPGLEVSRIITGLWQIADMERHGTTLDPDQTADHMLPYVEAGLSTFDMADHYGSSEIIAGKFKNRIKDERKVQLLTKWVPKPGKITREDVKKAIETALKRMQQSSIDLLQFHAWNYADPSWLDGLFYLNELKDAGLINQLGVTNFDSAHLRIALASGIPLVSNQICHSLIDDRAKGSMAKVCEEYNVKLLAFGTLAGGFLTDRWLGKVAPKTEDLTTWSQMKYKRFIDVAGGWEAYQNLLIGVKEIADNHQASIANIASSYILENKTVAAVILGARLGESEHIEDNKRMLTISLSPEEIAAIQTAQQSLNPIPGGCGDEYRKPPFLTATGDLSDHLERIPLPFTPIELEDNSMKVFSGTEWEAYAGYCRAVRMGSQIHVSGTTATHRDKLIGEGDAAAQTHFIIDKIEGAITSLGGSLEQVVRTRIYVNDLKHWEVVARAHGERFNRINPANTLVEAGLVGDGYMVEIEAEAVVQ